MKQHSHFRRWGAIYLLLALFLASWIGQFANMLIEVGNEARQHGEAFSMSDFWPQFWGATFENWQSEWLQLFVQGVVLLGLKHVMFKADAEDMEQVQMDLAEIRIISASRRGTRRPARSSPTSSSPTSRRFGRRPTSEQAEVSAGQLIGRARPRTVGLVPAPFESDGKRPDR